MATIFDNKQFKAMTLEDADRLFDEYVRLETERVRKVAPLEFRRAQLDEQAGAINAEYAPRLAKLTETLTRFAQCNPDYFDSPRYRKRPGGKYGFQSKTTVQLDDEGKVQEFSGKQQLGLFAVETQIKFDAKKIQQLLASGTEIPGARLIKSENFNISPDKKYIAEQATKK